MSVKFAKYRQNLLSNAKAGKYFAEQVIRGDFTGDTPECLVGSPQFLCHQFRNPDHTTCADKSRMAALESFDMRSEEHTSELQSH